MSEGSYVFQEYPKWVKRDDGKEKVVDNAADEQKFLDQMDEEQAPETRNTPNPPVPENQPKDATDGAPHKDEAAGNESDTSEAIEAAEAEAEKASDG